MITLIGIIIFFIPFFLMGIFKDKVVGFFTIFTASFLVHMIVALTTQYLKIFNYDVIISIYSAIDLMLLILYFFKYRHSGEKEGGNEKKKGIEIWNFTKSIGSLINKNKLVLVSFIIVFFNLYSVHYNFTGVVNTKNGKVEAVNATYKYPYFSDEWSAIAFANYTIDSHSLPIVNPLKPVMASGEIWHFNNPLVIYFSFLSDTFLFFGLDPLNGYIPLILVVGLIIITIFFVLLLSLGIDKQIAALCVLIVPHITNGGNLPGIWFLIPMIVALVFYLIILISYARDDIKLSALSTFVCLCLYPPFIVFVLPILLLLVFQKITKDIKKKILIFSGVFLLAFVVVSLTTFKDVALSDILSVLQGYLFRYNLVGGILHFPIWSIVPVLVLPFALLGFWVALKKKLYFLIYPLVLGLIYWVAYIDTEKVIIIDYPRVVVITSILVIVFFAISINYLLELFKKENKISQTSQTHQTAQIIKKNRNTSKYSTQNSTKIFIINACIAVSVLIAVVESFNYTSDLSYKNLKVQQNINPKGQLSSPAPTASEFLKEEDLVLFKGITKKIFISTPWKGLVLAASTGNYPLASKPSTVGVFELNYEGFVGSNCAEKKAEAIKFGINYAYTSEFSCPNFELMGSSTEGFFMYKFNPGK